MIDITPTLSINESDIQMDFIRASGPGGQNVNKVATAVQLRFDAGHSTALTPDTKARLGKLAGSRMTADGFVLIEAKRYRTQEQNRADALERLAALIRKALEKPKARHATRPSLTAQLKRVESKKRRGAIKRTRASGDKDWD